MQTTVAGAEVETQADGRAVVRWQVEGAPVAVDVATGPTPDGIDHIHQATVPAGETSLLVSGPADGRLFVSVAPHGTGPAVVVADRRVPFEGIQNFRDMGGYRTRAGRVVRWGQVFRADALHGLSTADLALYERLGLRAVYDLRGEIERAERPNPVPSRSLTITGRPAGTEPTSLPVAAEQLTAADGEQLLAEMYAGLLEHSAPQLGELYTGLAGSDGLPAVFHCHGGKDRTGIVAALLLEALGVEREVVLDDYVLTSRYRLREHQASTYGRLIESGMAPEAAAGVLSVPRWAMARALDELDHRHGGVDAYLTGPAGMAPDDLRTLRERLVAPAG